MRLLKSASMSRSAFMYWLMSAAVSWAWMSACCLRPPCQLGYRITSTTWEGVRLRLPPVSLRVAPVLGFW